MGQPDPNSFFCVSSFEIASRLVPAPQLEQVPMTFNLHTSQFIPHAPVAI
jgi:hypothetical protein